MKTLKITCVALTFSILLSIIAMVGVSAETPNYEENTNLIASTSTEETTVATEPTTEITEPTTATEPTTEDINLIKERKIKIYCNNIQKRYNKFKKYKLIRDKNRQVKSLEKAYKKYLDGEYVFTEITNEYTSTILAMRKNIITSYKNDFNKASRKKKIKLFIEVKKEYTAYTKNTNYKINSIKNSYKSLINKFQKYFIGDYNKSIKKNTFKNPSKTMKTLDLMHNNTALKELKSKIKNEKKIVLYNKNVKYKKYISKINKLIKINNKRILELRKYYKSKQHWIRKYTASDGFTCYYDEYGNAWDDNGNIWNYLDVRERI